MIFRAFHRQVRPTDEPQNVSLMVQAASPEETEIDCEDKRLGKLAVMRKVTRLHITARPELQGEMPTIHLNIKQDILKLS